MLLIFLIQSKYTKIFDHRPVPLVHEFCSAGKARAIWLRLSAEAELILNFKNSGKPNNSDRKDATSE
ncbi:hypothetical protein B9G53_05610 [Pseudanabaena sp. SR411]|nr:hypothetical protein B9G53_05610 [Pseudanabaena sp. SR411]